MMEKDLITSGCNGLPINPAPGDPQRWAETKRRKDNDKTGNHSCRRGIYRMVDS